MSDPTQLQLETREVSLSLQGGGRPIWSAIGTWLLFTALLTLFSALMGCFSMYETSIPPEINLVLLFAIGIVICLTSLMAAHMVNTRVSRKLYGQHLTEKLGEDFLNVKLQEANPDGGDANRHAMRFSARSANGDQVKITALLSSEQVFGNGTTCTYHLVITPV